MNNILLLSLSILIGGSVFAQQNNDQNPNYQRVAEKYYAIADSFSDLQSTTLQRTYKAYDWYEAKMQAKAERIAFRRQVRLIEAQNSYYNYSYNDDYPYYTYYNYPFFSSAYYPYNGYYGYNQYYGRGHYSYNAGAAIVPPLLGAAVGTAATIGLYHLFRR